MLNELRDECHKNAVEHGFWEVVGNDGIVVKDGEEKNTFAKCMALVVTEIGEAIEADRKPKDELTDSQKERLDFLEEHFSELGDFEFTEWYKLKHKGTVAEELSDILIRILDTSGHYNIDIEEAVKLKMRYNASRPYKHNKQY